MDPINGDPATPTSLNRYLFANCSPIAFTDPSGQMSLANLTASIAIQGILIGSAFSIGYRGTGFAIDVAGGTIFAAAFSEFAHGLAVDAAINVGTAGVTAGIFGLIKLIPFGSTATAASEAAPVLYTVYRSVNGKVVQYVGITINFARRGTEHAARFDIEVLATGLSKAEARGVEQALIELHGLRKYGGTLLNEINSISSKNRIYAEALKSGKQILQGIGYTVEGF